MKGRPWIAAATAFGAGALFGVGLLIAGMTRPGNVLSFLDVAGDWDPRLALVMGAAIAVHALALRWIARRSEPLFDVTFHMPLRRRIDRRLVRGAAVFGVGWGIAGYCPGPGLVDAASGSREALVFVTAMVVGMLLQRRRA